MVEQFEALYCYSICKSILMSELEEDNPQYACLVTGYTIQRSNLKQVPYYGLRSYENFGGPLKKLISKNQAISVLKNYSLFGRNCFYVSFKFINKMKYEILETEPVFQEPLTEQIAYQICNESTLGKQYKSPLQLIKDISAYPVRNLQFTVVQKTISQKFNSTLIYKWQEKIAQQIDKMIRNNFKEAAETKAVKKLEDLNPFIRRFLSCV